MVLSVEVALKNPIRKYIDKKYEKLTPEQVQKREEMSQIITKELENIVGNKDGNRTLHKYAYDYRRFRIDKGIYIVLLVLEITVYLILGLMNTTLAQKLFVTLPYLCMTIPMFGFLFKLFHVISMVEVMVGRKYNGIVIKVNQYSKFMLFFGIIMLMGHILSLAKNFNDINMQQEVIYMLFIISSCVISFILCMHTIRFKKKMLLY